MWVVCNKTKQCKDNHCLHKYAHEIIPLGSCKRRYCSVINSNVECDETERSGLIEGIKDVFKDKRELISA